MLYIPVEVYNINDTYPIVEQYHMQFINENYRVLNYFNISFRMTSKDLLKNLTTPSVYL